MSTVDRIFQAVIDNDLREVKSTLSRNPELVNAVDTSIDRWTNDYGFPILYTASICGHLEIARHLIEFGADIHARTGQGMSAIDAAIQFGYYDIAHLLIEKGTDVNRKNGFGMTPLHTAVHFYYDGAIGPFIETLLAKGANIDGKDNDGRTAFDIAASSGEREIAALLLRHGASITNIHSAVAAGDIDRVRTMLKESPELVHEGDKETHTRESLLQKASIWGHREIVKLLIYCGADVHAEDGHEETALFRAASKDIAEILLERGVNACARNISGSTPLHYARSLGIAQILVQHGADINAKDNSGWTPLDIALNEKNDDVAEYLIFLGAAVNRKSRSGAGVNN